MKKLLFALVLILNSLLLFSQKKDTADNIIIYGDSFLFSIHEPTGWNGDAESAKNFNANIIFYKSKADFQKGGTFIQILTYKKQDEQVEKDLDYEVSTIKEKNHDLKQKDIDADNDKLYPDYSKLIYVE